MNTTGLNTRVVKVAVAVLAMVTFAYGYASGPPAGRTGAPGEQTCIVCHAGTLNGGPGRVTISGVPEIYTPGETVTLTVRVEQSNRRRWGFQITALDSTNKQAGTFALIDRATTKTASGNGSLAGRKYVEQTTTGTREGTTGGASWELKWTAPSTDVGRVTFYASGNAANGNDASSGDSIYTTAVGSGTNKPNIIAPTYKKGKIIFQANGSNIENGATLEMSGGSLQTAETFEVVENSAGTKWVVKKSARSTPGGLSVDEALPVGGTVTLVVHNPDGATSAPVSLSR